MVLEDSDENQIKPTNKQCCKSICQIQEIFGSLGVWVWQEKVEAMEKWAELGYEEYVMFGIYCVLNYKIR